jgi:hypothetical protein
VLFYEDDDDDDVDGDIHVNKDRCLISILFFRIFRLSLEIKLNIISSI